MSEKIIKIMIEEKHFKKRELVSFEFFLLIFLCRLMEFQRKFVKSQVLLGSEEEDEEFQSIFYHHYHFIHIM